MPNSVLPKIAPEQMPANLQAIWNTAKTNTGDATFVEVGANNPGFVDWYVPFPAHSQVAAE